MPYVDSIFLLFRCRGRKHYEYQTISFLSPFVFSVSILVEKDVKRVLVEDVLTRYRIPGTGERKERFSICMVNLNMLSRHPFQSVPTKKVYRRDILNNNYLSKFIKF